MGLLAESFIAFSSIIGDLVQTEDEDVALSVNSGGLLY